MLTKYNMACYFYVLLDHLYIFEFSSLLLLIADNPNLTKIDSINRSSRSNNDSNGSDGDTTFFVLYESEE